MLFAVATAVAAIQAKLKNKMLSLSEMIEKSLLLKEFFSTTLSPDPDATSKSLSGGDSLSKASTERWNQANLGYFDPHFDRVYEEDEVVFVGKEVYYKNIVLII